jgi:hypothetical protein
MSSEERRMSRSGDVEERMVESGGQTPVEEMRPAMTQRISTTDNVEHRAV